MSRSWPETLRRLAGIELAPVSHVERLVSGIGGFIAIYVIFLLERDLLGEVGAAIMVASMGASAVLLFAVPHGALSQPWAVVVGHVASAAIGVAAARSVGDTVLAAALAVGIAIAAMHYLRAIHPPGGATALTAVIGGPQVHALGFQLVVTPVLVNALIIVSVAVAVNAFFAWRRYPAGLARILSPPPSETTPPETITHADFVAALESVGTFVDISEEEFLKLRGLMREAAAARRVKPEDIGVGAYYSNGAFGADWSVRRVVDAAPGAKGDVIWRSVAGPDRNETGIATRRDFALWAAYQVERSESTWVRTIAGAGASQE
ncbi:MAG: HPP family protein [Hyphomicrobiaceae bacterium]|nr:HPP family protein [Hyphomicrobiaceae bacterium]